MSSIESPAATSTIGALAAVARDLALNASNCRRMHEGDRPASGALDRRDTTAGVRAITLVDVGRALAPHVIPKQTGSPVVPKGKWRMAVRRDGVGPTPIAPGRRPLSSIAPSAGGSAGSQPR